MVALPHESCFLRPRGGDTWPFKANKAILAVAASILTAAYYLLRDEVPYRELGSQYFVSYDQQRTLLRLTRRIQELGYHVEISKAA